MCTISVSIQNMPLNNFIIPSTRIFRFKKIRNFFRNLGHLTIIKTALAKVNQNCKLTEKYRQQPNNERLVNFYTNGKFFETFPYVQRRCLYLRIFSHPLVTKIFAAPDVVHHSRVGRHGDHLLLVGEGFLDVRQKLDEDLLELRYSVRRSLKFSSVKINTG